MKKILVYSFTAIFLITALNLSAQYKEEIKNYTAFSIGNQPNLILRNKYGNITCNVWEKDSIGVEYTISAQSKKSEILENLTNSVEIVTNSFTGNIDVETTFRDNARLIKTYLSKLDPFNSNELSIDYKIYIPAGTNVEIVNSFGNVFIEKISGDVEVKLEYGDLRIEDLSGRVELDLKSGRMIGRSIDKADIKLRNYDLRLKSINNLDLESSHSEIRIDYAKFVRLNMRGDEFEVKKIENVKGASYNSDIELRYVVEELNLNLRNSTLIVEEFDDNVRVVEIEEESSQIDLNVSNISLALEADVEEAQLSVPKTVSDIERNVINEKKDHRSVSLNYNGGGSYVSKFKFTGIKGSFFLTDE